MNKPTIIAYAIVIVAVGAVLWPSLHLMLGNISTAGFQPLVATALTALSYVFLVFVAYVVIKLGKK